MYWAPYLDPCPPSLADPTVPVPAVRQPVRPSSRATTMQPGAITRHGTDEDDQLKRASQVARHRDVPAVPDEQADRPAPVSLIQR
jgi:hypothetical protein